MRKILIALAIVIATPLPALAQLSCGSLLMPAAQLKEISRGITSHHSGIDLVAPAGSPLRAAAAGTVIFAAPYFAYGLMVDLQHADGIVTRYAHMASFAPGIQPGARVAVGGLLGKVGRTGNATTDHVHFEVRIAGRPVDPKPYLALAPCTPRTPLVRIEEARAPDVPRVITPNRRADWWVNKVVKMPAAPINGRPGGLLE